MGSPSDLSSSIGISQIPIALLVSNTEVAFLTSFRMEAFILVGWVLIS